MPTTYIQDKAKEQQALADLLKRPEEGGSAAVGGVLGEGADVNAALDADPALRQLVQEQAYMRSYGTGNPTFATPETTPSPNSGYAYMTGDGNASIPDAPNTYGAPDGIGDGAGGYGSSLIEAIQSRFPSYNLETDQDVLYEQEVARIQNQIDAINALYDARITDEREAGRGREGQTNALSAVSGTAFSPFGTAQREQTRQKNQQIINAINAERAAEISALYGGASDAARESARANVELTQNAAGQYIDSIATAYNLSFAERQALQEAALRRGEATGYIDGAPTLDLRRFLSSEEQAYGDSARADAYLKIAQDQAARLNLDLIQGGDGRYYTFDPNTGDTQLVAGLPGYSVGGGSGSGSGSSGYSYADLLADPLTRDALTAYESAAGVGSINNLSEEDLLAIRSIYGSRTGNQSPVSLDGLFTPATGSGSYLDYLNK